MDLWKSYPVPKGLAVKYSFHWGYGCDLAEGDAPGWYEVGLWPSFLGIGDCGEFRDWWLIKL